MLGDPQELLPSPGLLVSPHCWSWASSSMGRCHPARSLCGAVLALVRIRLNSASMLAAAFRAPGRDHDAAALDVTAAPQPPHVTAERLHKQA